MKILIAVPTYESVYPDTFRSIYGLDADGHDVSFECVRGYDCAAARNKIAQAAMDHDADYVLMVDSDVVLPHDALRNLLEGGKDVVLGYYAHRGPANQYTGRVCVCKTGFQHYPLESEYTAAEMHDLREAGETKIEIHGGGMGCALIRTDVFRKMKYPWFKWSLNKNGSTLSEDLYFCEMLHRESIPIYTDARVGCGHIFRYIQWPE